MTEATFQVVGPHVVHGHKPGEKFTADLGPNGHLLVEGGHLKVVSVENPACPACVEAGKKRPPRFDSHAELVDHYADKHPGYVAPAGEEA